MKTSVIILFAASAVGLTAFSNCSGGFQADSSSVSAPNSVLKTMGDISLLRETDAEVYSPPDLTYGPQFKIKVTTTCSDYGSATLNGNIVRSTTSLVLKFTNKATGFTCTYSDLQMRDHLIGEHKLVVPNVAKFCPNVTAGDYSLSLIGNGGSYNLLSGEADPIELRVDPNHKPFDVTIAKDSFNVWTMTPAANMAGIVPSVLLGANQQGSDMTVGSDAHGFDELCDHRASPLLVQLHPGSSYINRIELSLPSKGVMFDILGAHDSPAHTKRLISWFTPETLDGNFFVALPDASGAVTGIDQLFGDNTQGPDGQFATNGYEALRKYDANHDGKITSADPIFAQLRLWQDKNLDGVAQSFELYTLDSFGVTEIDLNYDSGFSEVDQFGNQIKFKSVVRTSDGLPHVMYDIWFQYF